MLINILRNDHNHIIYFHLYLHFSFFFYMIKMYSIY